MNRESGYSASTSFLLSQVGAHMARQFAERVHVSDLSPREFAVLNSLAHDGPWTQQQLADSLGMHRNNMATLAEQMEAKGLVDRRANPVDKRALLVGPTPNGLERLRTADMAAPGLDREISDVLGTQTARELRQALQHLATGLGLQPGIHPHLAATYPGSRRTISNGPQTPR